MELYSYKKCSTCQNALRFLKQKNRSFNLKEIDETPPSKEQLAKVLSLYKGQIKKLFNTSGQLYRELGLSKKIDSMSIDEALSLLSENGMLIKRPFLIGKEIGLVGFNEEEWSHASDQSSKRECHLLI